jgi:hypothetical protein
LPSRCAPGSSKAAAPRCSTAAACAGPGCTGGRPSASAPDPRRRRRSRTDHAPADWCGNVSGDLGARLRRRRCRRHIKRRLMLLIVVAGDLTAAIAVSFAPNTPR